MSANMYCYTSSWGDANMENVTFKMLPLTSDCAYQECIYDPAEKILAVISKVPKQNYIMTHKIDDNGDPVFLKDNRKRPNGKPYKEERRLVETYTEYYITDLEDIKEFVKMTAINPDKALPMIGADPKPVAKLPQVPPGDITIESIPTMQKVD